MTGIGADGFGRRAFLRGAGIAAGAARFAPRLLATAAPLAAVETARAAEAVETGQTVRLAQYAAALRFEEIPPEVLQRAKDCIADTVSTILFGAQFPWSRMIVAQARRTGAGGRSALFGTGERVHATSAALAHGALTHAFEQDNLTAPDSGAHPGAALFSSGLAVAQERGAGGRDLLTAFVAGAEVMIRIGRATKRTNEARGFHAPGTVGPFGSAVVSGKLMGFDAEKMTNALGIAGSLSGGLLEFARSGNGAMVKRLHLGRAAESGVLAASLAAGGFTGPTTVLEGEAGFLRAFCNDRDLAQLTAGLGQTWSSMTIMMKRFAAHITAHTALEAIVDLRAMYGISGDDVAALEIAGSRRMATVNNIPAPPDILIGQYSVPFCAALALYRNPVDPNSFTDAATQDPAIRNLSQKIRMTIAPGQEDADFSSTVTLTLADGRVLTRRVTEFTGTPARPLSVAELREKYLLMVQAFPRGEMELLFDRIQNLERETGLDWLTA